MEEEKIGAPNDRPLLRSTSHDLGASEGRRRGLFKSYKLHSDASLGKVVGVRAQDMILKHNLEQLLENCLGWQHLSESRSFGTVFPRQEIRSTRYGALKT